MPLISACLSTGLALIGALPWEGHASGQEIPKTSKPAPTKGTVPASASAPAKPAPTATAKPAAPPAKSTETPKKADDAEADPDDPSQTRKDIATEIFRDPRAEAALDINAFKEIKGGSKIPTLVDIDSFKRMAGDANGNLDRELIRRVVEAEVQQLTDHRNIQALVDPPPGLGAGAAVTKAIHNATSLLLEATFAARSAKNYRFQDEFNRMLLLKLTPVLSNHLISRVQAMLILGETGNPGALKVFLDQIKDPKQPAVVKLWACKGISNIKQFGRVSLAADVDISTARTIAEMLDTDKALPWPVQMRALEALGDLRQGHSAADPKKLEMATVAMRFLSDTQLRPELRAEAARALGLMQISSAVADYNYDAVAHLAAQVAADLGDRIGKGFTDNPNKSEYYAAFLIGPILECFEGTPTMRDAGLIRATAPPAVLEKAQARLDLIKAIAKPSIELIRSGRGQAPARQAEIATRTAALRDYLQKNAPKDLLLIPGASDKNLAEGRGVQ